MEDSTQQKLIKYKGEQKTLKEWCRQLDLDYRCIIQRIKRLRWTVEESFETPIRKHKERVPFIEHYKKKNIKIVRKKLIEYKGEQKTLPQWCRQLDLDYQRVYLRIRFRGWTAEEAFETPIKRTKRFGMSYRSAEGRIPKEKTPRRVPMEERKHLIEYKGEKKPLAEWCRLLNLRYHRMYSRMKGYGWTVEEAFETIKPKKEKVENKRNRNIYKKIIEYKGEQKTLKEWCKHLDLNYQTAYSRLKGYGWSVEDTFEMPKVFDKKTNKALRLAKQEETSVNQ